jgi:hypothetical protein
MAAEGLEPRAVFRSAFRKLRNHSVKNARFAVAAACPFFRDEAE